MSITDEQLSAFLDAELPEDEMERVREQLVADESLANRLAELAMVDDQIATHYSRIDEQPMPAALAQLLARPQQPTPAQHPLQTPAPSNVIRFPLAKKIVQVLQNPMAIAACTLLVVGFGMVQLLPGNQNANDWPAIAQVLEQTPSNNEQLLEDGSRVKPRLTFINNQGNYCRQFLLVQGNKGSENIACRDNNQWQLSFSAQQEVLVNDDYQTASGGSLLDDTLDDMMQGDAFDLSAEQQAINQHWSH